MCQTIGIPSKLKHPLVSPLIHPGSTLVCLSAKQYILAYFRGSSALGMVLTSKFLVQESYIHIYILIYIYIGESVSVSA